MANLHFGHDCRLHGKINGPNIEAATDQMIVVFMGASQKYLKEHHVMSSASFYKEKPVHQNDELTFTFKFQEVIVNAVLLFL